MRFSCFSRSVRSWLYCVLSVHVQLYRHVSSEEIKPAYTAKVLSHISQVWHLWEINSKKRFFRAEKPSSVTSLASWCTNRPHLLLLCANGTLQPICSFRALTAHTADWFVFQQHFLGRTTSWRVSCPILVPSPLLKLQESGYFVLPLLRQPWKDDHMIILILCHLGLFMDKSLINLHCHYCCIITDVSLWELPQRGNAMGLVHCSISVCLMYFSSIVWFQAQWWWGLGL